jgi:hypothetical protein
MAPPKIRGSTARKGGKGSRHAPPKTQMRARPPRSKGKGSSRKWRCGSSDKSGSDQESSSDEQLTSKWCGRKASAQKRAKQQQEDSVHEEEVAVSEPEVVDVDEVVAAAAASEELDEDDNDVDEVCLYFQVLCCGGEG